MVMTIDDDTALVARLRALIGEKGTPQQARDPVNLATIRTWCDAMGEQNPVHTDPAAAARSPWGEIVAPSAMLGVWTLAGNVPRVLDPGCPRSRALSMLDEAGYPSVIGTDTEERYLRPLRLGEQLTGVLSLVEVSDQKTTGLGTGYFLTTLTEFANQQGELVGTWKFRVLKFKPRVPTEEELAKKQAQKEQLAKIPKHMLVRPRPAVMKETAFFWEGCKAGELRIQQCAACAHLAHPPVVRCPACGGYDLRYTVASGKATLHSYVEPVYPPMPFMTYPYVVGLVDLEEGTRLLTNIVHCPPDLVKVGMALELVFQETDPDMRLPMFRPAPPPQNAATLAYEDIQIGQALPLWPVEVTTRLIVAGALATRDFEDIHHEVAAARRAGMKDLFMNVLTTNGLCSRYLGDWAGPQARVSGVKVRLGVPNVAGDTMTFSATVTDKQRLEGKGIVTLALRCSNSKGDHAKGDAMVELPLGGKR